MSARPRYHGRRVWPRHSGDAVHWAVRTFAQALGVEDSRLDRRGPRRQHRPRRTRSRRGEQRWLASAPRRGPFLETREPGHWLPRFYLEERPGNNWRWLPLQRPRDWRIYPMPRRGPPVALIEVPRWFRPELWEERRPRGSNPRGPLRGGPERSDDDPQTPENTTQREANEANGGNGEKKAKWPVIVTVDGDGHERKWGPLSRNTA